MVRFKNKTVSHFIIIHFGSLEADSALLNRFIIIVCISLELPQSLKLLIQGLLLGRGIKHVGPQALVQRDLRGLRPLLRPYQMVLLVA